MGARDFFWRKPVWNQKALSASPEVVQAIQERRTNFMPLIATPQGAMDRINARVVAFQSEGYGWLYRESPAVRTVVDFIARNVSQLALRLYERTSDIERHEVSDHPAAVLVRNPNSTTPGEQFIYDFVANWLIYNNAYGLKFRNRMNGELSIVTIPSHRVGLIGSNSFVAEGYQITRSDGSWFNVEPQDIIHWRGYNPDDMRYGISPLETLRKTLAEDAATQQANLELMKSGLLSPGWISRPLDAPDWSPSARDRFKEEWGNQRKDASRHDPVLEEGMLYHESGVSPKDAQMLDGRRFTVEQVASLYGVPLGLLGLGDGGNLEEQHREFYADVLPPITEMFACYLALSILKDEFMEDNLYYEFDLDEKLMGDERLKALVSATGAAVLTRNEARAMLNKPPKEGGEELITPLNVLVGGKPSPREMPPQNPSGPEQDGSARGGDPYTQSLNGHGKALEPAYRITQRKRRDRYHAEFEALLRGTFAEMEKSVKSKSERWEMDSTAKGLLDVFRPGKWIKKLSAALHRLMSVTVEREGGIAAARLNLADFQMDLVEHYLLAAAEGKATEIVSSIESALGGAADPDEVFTEAKTLWAPNIGGTIATQMTNFSHMEAAKQTPDASNRHKRWLVENLEKSAHPEMNNEVVGLTEPFSNGKQYPPYEHPNCNCMVSVT